MDRHVNDINYESDNIKKIGKNIYTIRFYFILYILHDI